MFEKGVIFGIYTITPVHAGSGSELSYIDLPIQRERHTNFPVIWGQSLKGVLRDAFRDAELEGLDDWKWKDKVKEIYKDEKQQEEYIKAVKSRKRDPPLTELIFGPPTELANKGSGILGVGDAKILLYPVRSARGVFVYVTSPLVLKRLIEDLRLINLENGNIPTEDFLTTSGMKIRAHKDFVGKINNSAVLEDLKFEFEEMESIESIVALINRFSPVEIDAKRVAIISDDAFNYFVKHTTEVVARIRIDDIQGTVAEGALWWEEYLPSDTLLYSVMPLLKETEILDSDKIIYYLITAFGDATVQIGGNATVGKGFCKLKAIRGDDNGKSEP